MEAIITAVAYVLTFPGMILISPGLAYDHHVKTCQENPTAWVCQNAMAKKSEICGFSENGEGAIYCQSGK